MTINRLLPQEFLSLIEPMLPAQLTLDDVITACHQPLRFSIRVNTLKNSVTTFCSLMSDFGWKFESIPWCDTGFWVELPQDATAPGKLPEHLTGLFYIQEASSMLPPMALFHGNDKPVVTVLDLAAAPGSKTTQIAALMNNKGTLVANEYSSSRIKALHSNLQRMGVSNTVISHFDGHVHGDYLENCFDAVLIDAPCSGEGTVRKDATAFKNWSLSHISEISIVQQGLLRSAFMALKPGGVLVYSTCALNFIENQQVCQSLMDQFGDQIEIVNLSNLFSDADRATTPEGYLHIWPQIYDSEGFFIAKFKKRSATNLSQPAPFKNRFPFSPVSPKQAGEIHNILIQQKLANINSSELYQRDNEIWYFPSHVTALLPRMKFQRTGLKLFETKGKNILFDHHAVTVFTTPDVEISREQLVEYLKGRDISFDNATNLTGNVYVGYQGKTVGLGKWIRNKIKNKLPRNLVNDSVKQ
ncbi:MAG: 16S rRNA (cytosine(1407)-C(5))-methyltransferase RsmF [Gammaproteobacteria bacterium]|nr:16S rRNA (cytosine(1407)-C(5))-methyltransferase RsmF [Gammaproteobacteria bacterium]